MSVDLFVFVLMSPVFMFFVSLLTWHPCPYAALWHLFTLRRAWSCRARVVSLYPWDIVL